MSDVGDEAEAVEALNRRLSIEAARAALPKASDVGSAECADCDDEISLERRAAVPGVRRCVECQAVRERRNRRV